MSVATLDRVTIEGHVSPGFDLRVIPDVRSAPEAREVAQPGLADLVDELRPDLGMAPVVLGLGPGEDAEVEHGAVHCGHPPEVGGVRSRSGGLHRSSAAAIGTSPARSGSMGRCRTG